MKQILKIFIVFLIVGLTNSCSDYLELDPLSDYSDAAVWNDPALIETFVNNIYRNALGFPFSIERLSDYSDESHFTPDWDVTNFNKCLMTSSHGLGSKLGNAPYASFPVGSALQQCKGLQYLFRKDRGSGFWSRRPA